MNYLARIIAILQRLLTVPPTVPPSQPTRPPDPLPEAPDGPPSPVPTPDTPKGLIDRWALAIRDFEGWSPVSHSYRHNHPGNLKGIDGKFIKYTSYAEGFAALKDYLTRACTGRHKAYRPEMTLRQFFAVYAPDGDLIITNYASYVAKKIGVTPDTVISTLI
jgi:hypothetical protein